MRRLYFATAIFMVSSSISLAAEAPTFRPLDPSMVASPAPVPAAPLNAEAPSTQVPAAPTHPISHSGEVIDSVGSGAIPSLPLEALVQNGISYLSGGISDEETEQLKMQEDNYNLRLLITGQAGQFVSDVVVTLKDASGTSLLVVNDAGPCLYAQVSPGKYSVEVSNANGNAKTVTLSVPAKAPFKMQIRI